MDLTDIEKLIIVAMADRNMNKSEAAKDLYIHRNTLTYHLDRIQYKTGLDPRKFYDLVNLVDMAKVG